MEKKVKSALMRGMILSYKFHSQLFDNAIQGIKDEDARKRLNNHTNHIVWMTGNLVSSRYAMLHLLGINEVEEFAYFFKDAKAIDDQADYPSLEALKKEWHYASPILYKKLQSLTDEDLLKDIETDMEMEIMDKNLLDMFTMYTDRESYLIGQIALLRKAFGYEAMKYTINPDIYY